MQDDLGARRCRRRPGRAAGLAERDERIGHVGVVRLAPALTPRVGEDLTAERLESVAHDGSLDGRQLAPNGDGAFESGAKANVAALPEPRFSCSGLFLGAPGGDDRFAPLAKTP